MCDFLLLAQATNEAGSDAVEVAKTAAPGLPGWVMILMILAIVILPFVLGQLIERALKLKDVAFRIGLVLFAITLGLAPFATRIAGGGSWKDAIRLGIDLAGGTNMVFQVDHEGAEVAEKTVDSELMNRMVGAIIRRINPSGTEEVTVRAVGQDRIEVIVPGADSDKVARTKKAITNLGQLEFAVLANEEDHGNIIEMADATDQSEIRDSNGKLIAAWKRVGTKAARDGGKPERKEVGTNDLVKWRDVETPDGETVREFLVVYDPDPAKRITGRLLKRASQTTSQSGPVVGFTFNTTGGQLFRRLTTKYQPRTGAGYKTRLAVLLNDEIHSAPTINAIIGAQGIIEGQFSQRELDELINVLNAGALEVPLIEEPVSEFTVSPLLGIDVQEKGKLAIISAAVAVFVFMLLYYWVAGAIADVCLLVNLILVMGTMSFIDATFTLPGLAGLVLTIGMAVDANVLIFERIREEQAKGSSLRMSIQNGFSRALTTIVDANVTTLITAVVLYMIGTDQVRGFAVTLFIGIVMSMFSALYLGRLIFDIMERKRWITEVKMASIIGKTDWNFISKTSFALSTSALLILIGMASFFTRGEDNLDIDFRGGSMVTFSFKDEPSVDEVRGVLTKTFEEKFGSDISLEQLKAEQEDGSESVLFRLRTTEQDTDAVAQAINEGFAGSPHELVRQHLEIGELMAIPANSESESGESESSEEPPAPSSTTTNPFAGGHEAQLTFTEEISTESVAADVADQIAALPGENGGSKYDETETLVAAASTVEPNNPTAKGTSFSLTVSPVVSEADLKQALEIFESKLSGEPAFQEVNRFDSAVAGETQIDALLALFFSLIAIVAYIWFRFQRITFGLAAVAALVHDVLCVLGLVALASYLSGNPIGSIFMLEDFKINLPMIAAFLTVVGYSLNDTIVVFDRIREVRGKNPALTTDMVNLSLNQTLSRTLLTSLTTFIVVFILYVIGGEGIHGFAFCLLLGVIVGTYSSIYIASPVLLWLMNRGTAAAK
ncbi:MAG: protein translocase subunit SecD [Planctomycetaceae bacterium]|nr:protein translocase subunit SecD [Planctomycetaceae bacterium]